MAEQTGGVQGMQGRNPQPHRGDGAAASPTSETAAIRAEIEETRERLGETLEEIGDRLNPQHLKEEVKHKVQDAAIEKVDRMTHGTAGRVVLTLRAITVVLRENPMLAAAAAVGLGWLIYRSRRRGSATSVRVVWEPPRSRRGSRRR